MWKFLRQLTGSPTGRSASSRVSLNLSLHILRCAALRWVMCQRILRSCGLLLLNRCGWRLCGGASGVWSLCRSAAASSPGCHYRLTMLYDLVEHHLVGAWTTDVIVQQNLEGWKDAHRTIWWLLAFMCFSAQGHQVTSHLRAQGQQCVCCVLCVQRWYSAYLGCNEWLLKLLLLSIISQPVCAFSSDLWHKQGIFVHTTATHWMFFFFRTILCKP